MFVGKRTYNLQNTEKHGTIKKNKFSVYKGLLLAMLSAVFYSLASVIVKLINNIHPGQLAIYRFLGILVFSFPPAVKCRENLLGPKDMRFLLFVRGILGAANTFLTFIAFRYLPLGESSVIIFSLPVFVTLAAKILLKEPCGVFQSLAVFTTVAGLLFTSRLPLKIFDRSVPYTKESLWGLLSGLGSLLFGTFQLIIVRKMKSLHYSVIMLNFSCIAILGNVVLTALVGDFKWHDCDLQGLYIVMLGVLSYTGQSLMTMALLCEMAGPVITMRAAVDIAMGFVWQVVMFSDIPDAFSTIGAVLVGLSVMFVAFRKWVSELPPDSTFGRKLNWVLK